MMRLKINNVPGYSGELDIVTDKNGVPVERFWRNRLREAEIDNCVEVLKPKSNRKKEK